MRENTYVSIALSSRREIDPVGTEWLAKVSGAPEKNNYTRPNFIKHKLNKLKEKGEIQWCSPNKSTYRIYHSNMNYFS